jgi:hypothetical protein
MTAGLQSMLLVFIGKAEIRKEKKGERDSEMSLKVACGQPLAQADLADPSCWEPPH